VSELLTLNAALALLSLSALEIVLGIDNLVFIAILSSRLPKNRQKFGRVLGLAMGALGRIVLLFAITWVVTLEQSVAFTVFEHELTWKDIILLLGGAFLLAKGTWEIHHTLESVDEEHAAEAKPKSTMLIVITQILLMDLVFSIDSVLTAIGMVPPADYEHAWVPLSIMVTAVVLAIIVMVVFAGPVSRFVQRHPTMKMLALSFLLLIGVVLIAEGLHQHIPRGYIYFAMGFSVIVEMLNLKLIKSKKLKTVTT